MIITIKYPCKYRLNFAQNYVFSGDKGYNINGKFHSLKSLKPKLEKIPKKEYCPFE